MNIIEEYNPTNHNPFKNKDKDKVKDKYGFTKNAIGIGAMVGTIYGVSKVMGPAKKLVEKYADESILHEISKKAEKSIIDEMVLETDFDGNINLFKDNFKDFSNSLLSDKELLELDTDISSQLSKFHNALLNNNAMKFRQLNQTISQLSSEFKVNTPVMIQAIKLYAQRNAIDPKELNFVQRMHDRMQDIYTSNRTNIKTSEYKLLEKIHNNLLKDQEYKMEFLKTIRKWAAVSTNVKNNIDKKVYNKLSVNEMLKLTKDWGLESNSHLRHVKLEMLSRGHKEMMEAGSMDIKNIIGNDKQFNDIGISSMGGYHPKLKDLKNALNNYSKSGVDYDIKYLPDDHGIGFIEIRLFSENGSGKGNRFRIPLAQDGFISPCKMGVTAFKDIGEIDIDRQIKYTNLSHHIFDNIIRILKSDTFKNTEVENGIDHIVRSVNRVVNNIPSILADGTLLEMIQEMSRPEVNQVLNSKTSQNRHRTNSNNLMLKSAADFLKFSKIQSEAKLNKGRVIHVSIDTETITSFLKRKAGPQHMAAHPHTHITQIAFAIWDGVGGNSKMASSDSISSSFAVKNIKETKQWDPKDIHFIKEIIGKKDVDMTAEQVIDGYIQHLDALSKGQNTKEFTTDKEILDAAIESIYKKLDGMNIDKENDKVVIVWKNGFEYENILYNTTGSTAWKQMREEFPIIDIGLVAKLRQKQTKSNESTSLDNMVIDLLNRVSKKDTNIALPTEWDLKTPEHAKLALNILTSKGHYLNGNEPIVTVEQNLLKNLQNSNTGAHGNALYDVIFTKAVYNDAIIRQMKGDTSSGTQKFIGFINSMHVEKRINERRNNLSYDDIINFRYHNAAFQVLDKWFTNTILTTGRKVRGSVTDKMLTDYFPLGLTTNLSKQPDQNLRGVPLEIKRPKPILRDDIYKSTIDIRTDPITSMNMMDLVKKRREAFNKSNKFKDVSTIYNMMHARVAYVLNTSMFDEGLMLVDKKVGNQIKLPKTDTFNINAVTFRGKHFKAGNPVADIMTIVDRKVAAMGGWDKVHDVQKLYDDAVKHHPAFKKGQILSLGGIGNIKLGHNANLVKVILNDGITNSGSDAPTISLKFEYTRNLSEYNAVMKAGMGDKSIYHIVDYAPFGHDIAAQGKWVSDGNAVAFKNIYSRKIVFNYKSSIYAAEMEINHLKKDLNWKNNHKSVVRILELTDRIKNNKKDLNEFAAAIGGKYMNGSIVINTSEALKNTNFSNLSGGINEHYAKGVLGVDVPIDLIDEFLTRTGDVHTDESISTYFNTLGGGNAIEGKKKALAMVAELKKGIDSKLNSAPTALLDSINNSDIDQIRFNAYKQIDLMLIPKIGRAKYVEAQKFSNRKGHNEIALVFSGVDFFSVLSAEGREFNKYTHHMSRSVLNEIENSRYLTQEGKKYIVEHVAYNMTNSDRSALELQKRILTGELTSQLSTSKGLTIKNLESLINSDGLVALQKGNKKDFIKNLKYELDSISPNFISQSTEDSFFDYFKSITGNYNVTDLDEIKELRHRSNILYQDLVKRNSYFGIDNSNRMLSLKDVNKWANVFKDNKGLLTITPEDIGIKNEGFVVDVNKIIDSINDYSSDKSKGKIAKNKFLAFVTRLQQDTGETVVKKGAEEGQFIFKKLFTMGFDQTKLLANKLDGDLFVTTNTLQSSYLFLDAAYKLGLMGEDKYFGSEQIIDEFGNIDFKTNLNNVKLTPEQRELNMNSQKELMTKFFFLNSIESSMSAPKYKLEGTLLNTYGANSLFENAIKIQKAGNYEELLTGKFGNKADVKNLVHQFTTLVDNIVGSNKGEGSFNYDTWMTESTFKKLDVSAKGGIRKNILDKIGRKKDRRAIMDRVLSGEGIFGGFMGRYPQESQVEAAFQESIIRVIPDKFKGIFEVNDDSFYTWTMLKSMQKADHDGDQQFLILKDFSTIKESMDYLKKIREHHHNIGDIIKDRTQSFFKFSGFDYSTNETNFTVSGKGGRIYRVTKQAIDSNEYLNVENLFGNKLENWFYETNTNLPSFVTNHMVEGIRGRGALDTVMKDGIGKYTIAIESAIAITKSGAFIKNPDPNIFINDMSHGLSVFLQDYTNLAKKGTKEAAVEAASLLKIIQGDLRDKTAQGIFKKKFLSNYSDILEYAKDSDAYNSFINGTSTDSKAKGYYDLVDSIMLMSNVMYQGRQSENLGTNIDAIIKTVTQRDLTMIDVANARIHNNPANQEEIIKMFNYGKNNVHKVDMTDRLSEVGDDLWGHLKFAEFGKKLSSYGKFAAIGAAAVIGAGFFSSMKNSNNMSPSGAFSNLGDNNFLFTEEEIHKDSAIDMVNPSFSKQAFVRMNDISPGQRKSTKSKLIKGATSAYVSTPRGSLYNVRSNPNWTYNDYTSRIGKFGSSELDRRTKF